MIKFTYLPNNTVHNICYSINLLKEIFSTKNVFYSALKACLTDYEMICNIQN